MATTVERKLTTILCADVEGYSRLMGRDEVGTLTTLRRHRDALGALIERHRGRVVNTWGDGLIAEFPSVVEGVQCAIEAQKELRARNVELDRDRRLEFRIGLNLGDVMIEGDDLYGEGVNVAARLQALARPGGIVVSGTVHDHVRSKLAVAFEPTGVQRVKNIAEPVSTFRVRLDDAASESRLDSAPSHSSGDTSPGATAWLPQISSRERRLLAWFIVIATFLVLVNLFSNARTLWFQWPILVIGLAVAVAWLWRAPATAGGRNQRLLLWFVVPSTFFTLVNVFSGLHEIWFQWPVLAIGLVVALLSLRRA